LYRVHAEFQSDLAFARQLSHKFDSYTIGRVEALAHVFVEF
jgi:hypothetical protein